jgi:hypothetical protein
MVRGQTQEHLQHKIDMAQAEADKLFKIVDRGINSERKAFKKYPKY